MRFFCDFIWLQKVVEKFRINLEVEGEKNQRLISYKENLLIKVSRHISLTHHLMKKHLKAKNQKENNEKC